jgi:hypothetical protein
MYDLWLCSYVDVFHQANLANRERSNVIGWRQTLTTSPANHFRVIMFVTANVFFVFQMCLGGIY